MSEIYRRISVMDRVALARADGKRDAGIVIRVTRHTIKVRSDHGRRLLFSRTDGKEWRPGLRQPWRIVDDE